MRIKRKKKNTSAISRVEIYGRVDRQGWRQRYGPSVTSLCITKQGASWLALCNIEYLSPSCTPPQYRAHDYIWLTALLNDRNHAFSSNNVSISTTVLYGSIFSDSLPACLSRLQPTAVPKHYLDIKHLPDSIALSTFWVRSLPMRRQGGGSSLNISSCARLHSSRKEL